jgi:hypothetical protein
MSVSLNSFLYLVIILVRRQPFTICLRFKTMVLKINIDRYGAAGARNKCLLECTNLVAENENTQSSINVVTADLIAIVKLHFAAAPKISIFNCELPLNA